MEGEMSVSPFPFDKIKTMGWFSRKQKSSLPAEVLDAVHTMQDDLDGKKRVVPSLSASSLPVGDSASPFAFAAAPAMKNKIPVNENGLTSPITVTKTDTSAALPDPRSSSPFMQAEGADMAGEQSEDVSRPLALEPKEVSSTPPLSPVAPSTVKPFVREGAPVGSTSFSQASQGGDAPVYAASDTTKKNSHIFMVGMTLLVLALLAGGAFAYFSLFAKKPAMSDAPASVPEASSTDESAKADMGNQDAPGNDMNIPFTLSSPNYLPIDVETVTDEQFRSILASKEKLMQSNNMTDVAVEFFVTDTNNNPIAFARFATLMGIVFPQAVMDQIDESFSLYLYNDGQVARAALALSMKNKDALEQAVKKDESALPFALQALYLDPSVTKITAGTFKSGSYASHATRYFNIGTSGLSNDYAFTAKHWVIGTSAKAFRKILDAFGESL
jgi:hypothetical protein